jgi:hypothetical protein
MLLLESELDIRAHVAQSVEHVLGKDEVTGSIPVVGSSRTGVVSGQSVGCQVSVVIFGAA